MVVVGYGQIIPQSIIDLAPLGIINVHASLLPKYRGAAPIQWAIANGEAVTGVTTMRIDAGLDTGDILLSTPIEIPPDETALEISERLARLGAALLVQTLVALDAGSIVPRPQDHSSATYAPVLTKEDGRIDWSRSAAEIHNRVRGFQPWPGAYTSFRGQKLLIARTRRVENIPGGPGRLHAAKNRLLVSCGNGTGLEVLELQLEGRKRNSAMAFVNGQRLAENEILGEVTS
jgi:methionyl-tRNA formyltransferase